MRSRNKGILLLLPLVLCSSALCQSAKILPLGLQESTMVEQLRLIKAQNPGISSQDLAKAANDLFVQNGLSFRVYFDAMNCSTIKAGFERQKNTKTPPKFSFSLQSVGSDKASLALPPPKVTSDDCARCYAELPILEITSKDFVTRLLGQNVKFALPPNLLTELVIQMESGKPKRFWRVPFAGTPIGISYDEAVVYLAFDDPELKDLSLAAFETGAFEITTRAEAEDGGRGVPDSALVINGSSHRSMRFDRWQKKYLIAFAPSCGASNAK